MAVEFTPEQQELFNTTLAEKQKQWGRKYDGYTSPSDLAKIREEYDAKIAELNTALTESQGKAANYDKDIAERDAKIKAYELHSVKSRVAHELGLTYEAVEYLSGDDEDAIKKSAEGLKSLMGTRPPVPGFNGERGNNTDALRKLAANIGKN